MLTCISLIADTRERIDPINAVAVDGAGHPTAVINVLLAVDSSKTSDAVAEVPVEVVDALPFVLAGGGVALVHLLVAVLPAETRGAVAEVVAIAVEALAARVAGVALVALVDVFFTVGATVTWDICASLVVC